jgi:hypothetical protein
MNLIDAPLPLFNLAANRISPAETIPKIGGSVFYFLYTYHRIRRGNLKAETKPDANYYGYVAKEQRRKTQTEKQVNKIKRLGL